jgi:hypothetical protein
MCRSIVDTYDGVCDGSGGYVVEAVMLEGAERRRPHPA